MGKAVETPPPPPPSFTQSQSVMADAAERIKNAYDSCLEAGEKTGDLGGSLGTKEFAAAVIARL